MLAHAVSRVNRSHFLEIYHTYAPETCQVRILAASLTEINGITFLQKIKQQIKGILTFVSCPIPSGQFDLSFWTTQRIIKWIENNLY